MPSAKTKKPPKPKPTPQTLLRNARKEITQLLSRLEGTQSQLDQVRHIKQTIDIEKATYRLKLATVTEEKERLEKSLENATEEVRFRLQREIDELRATLGQPVRRRMPTSRPGLVHKFSIAGHEGYVIVGLFEDGTPGELFVEIQKEGSTIGGMMDTIGVLTSMALQYGVPLESMVGKFSYQRYEPSGYTNNDDIKMAHSITDYVFRWMAITFIPGWRERNANALENLVPGSDLNALPG